MTITVGSLFTGYDGLGLAVEAVFRGHDVRTLFVADIDQGACKLLDYRFPKVPNLGDVSKVDWRPWRGRIDVMTGGFPCQDVSGAGKQAGLVHGTRSGLWHEFLRAIDETRPHMVVIENVRGLLTARGDTSAEFEAVDAEVAHLERVVMLLDSKYARAVREGNQTYAGYHTRDRHRILARLRRAVDARRRAERRIVRAVGTVLGSLAGIGYDAQWLGLRAADVGAPHGRFRVVIVAHPQGHPWRLIDGDRATASLAADLGHQRAGRARDGWAGPTDGDRGPVLTLLPTPAVNDMGEGKTVEAWDEWTAKMKAAHGQISGQWRDQMAEALASWGDYAAAIHRWETLTRPAPAPTEAGPKGSPRLSPHFTEWMMGVPRGWICDVPGLTRNEKLKLCGNGVVPQQMEAAIRWLLWVSLEVAS